MAASARPRRSISRLDYRSLADISVPKRTRTSTKSHSKENSESPDRLYRLRVLEEDKENDLVKVRYIGYSSNYDEWRSRKDVVRLNGDEQGSSSDENDDTNPSESLHGLSVAKRMKQFCLYEELGSRIKSLLLSYRKADPVCCISMSFDTIYFDGLIRRSANLSSRTSHSRRQMYTVPTLTKLDDILGCRWYIRGINAAGDFCFVTPGTVKFYLKQCKGKIDFQMQADGTLSQYLYDEGYHLIFQFVRGDGTCSQWSDILKSCQVPSIITW